MAIEMLIKSSEFYSFNQIIDICSYHLFLRNETKIEAVLKDSNNNNNNNNTSPIWIDLNSQIKLKTVEIAGI